MDNDNQNILSLAKALHYEFIEKQRPPDLGFHAESEKVIPKSIVRGTRGYIEAVVNQINGCFEKGWYDACAVMIRRLVETLLIEAFENKGIDNKIKDQQDNFLPLDDIINKAIAEQSWNLNRETKRALPKIKKIGDLSAHSRRFNAHFKDIENITNDVRNVVQELIYLASFK